MYYSQLATHYIVKIPQTN